MPDVHDDVTPAPSADAPEETPTVQVTDTTGTESRPDRPVENLKAEFDRKYAKLQSQLDAAIQYIAQQRQPAPMAPPAAPTATVSDEDLWLAAQGGDRRAFEEYQRRIARREAQDLLGTQQRTNIITAQLQALIQKYPVLNDGTHPLTQRMNQAYQLYQQNGYAAGPATLLEAAKTAIADSPDLVSDLYTRGAQTREQGRQSATARAQGGVMGASSRTQESTPRQTTRPLSPEEKALAQRMGVKDAAGAKARFLKRRAEGLSNLGAVGGMLNEEDL